MKNKHLISIVGPTAIGKTSLSIKLAKKLGCEIISADSRQFFKEMEIGTAKPTKEEMDGVPHHFVDFISVDEKYTAGQFEKDVLTKLEELFEKNDTVIMVGGSGLYVKAVLNGIDEVPADEKIREELNERLIFEGIRPLQLELKELDEEHFNRMDIRNPQRLIRALEVCLVSGKPYSDFRKRTVKERPFSITRIGLTADRELIYDRINQRVDLMMEAGLEKEAKILFPKKELNSLNTVGYKELFDYFEEKITLEQAIEKIKQNTRNFAKRQMTWFKKDEGTTWFQHDEVSKIESFIDETL